MKAHLPIALFDSGVGGLTVMREVARLLPCEDLIYLGDTARVPYGTRSPEVIQKYTEEAVRFLLEKNIKLLIIACHTASAYVLPLLQKRCPVPVLGTIQGGFEKLLRATRVHRVAVLGTSSTIKSGLYQNLMREHSPKTQVFPIACPLFVPFIEEGLLDHPATEQIAAHYLHPLQEHGIDAALLACTHYPLIRPIIQQTLGPDVALIEPAEEMAREALRLLSAARLLNPQTKGSLQFYATDDPNTFATLAQRFFGAKVLAVHLVARL